MFDAKIKLQNGKWASIKDITTDKLPYVDYNFMNTCYGEEEFKAVMECVKRQEYEHRLRFIHLHF